MLLLELLLVAAFAGAYVFLNVLLSAWLSRNLQLWRRRARRALNGVLDGLSTARAWVTITSHLAAVTFLIYLLAQPLQLIWLALVLMGYIFFISALTISLLAQVPFVRKLWDDPFMKLSTIAIPIPMVYLAKGYASDWLGGITSSSASNFPMAYLAATCFTLLLGVLIALSITLLAFEVLFLATVARSKVVGPKFWSKATWHYLFSTSPRRPQAARQLSRVVWQRGGALGLLFCTFIACVFGTHAISALVSQRLGGVLLSAIAFDFDGAPATRCELNKDERKLADRDEPILKAAFLSTAQDKALLMTRGPNLFRPVVLRELVGETDPERKLNFGRVVKCYETKD